MTTAFFLSTDVRNGILCAQCIAYETTLMGATNSTIFMPTDEHYETVHVG